MDTRENNIKKILKGKKYPLSSIELKNLSEKTGYSQGDIEYIFQKMNKDLQYNKKYADGGMMYDLKEDDYVWNEVGKKLIVDKVTKDEYYLTSFGQWGASPFSKSKVNSYIKSGEWTLKPKMAKGGAIYEGDKVKIKDSGKKMVVKDISKGRKGYVEFSGDAGTYLKGDLEKMAKGGAVPVENSKMLGKTITIQLPTEVKPFKDKVIIEYGDFVMGNKGFWSKEYIVKKSEDGGMMAKGGKTKQDPPIVRGYFEDEPYEYAKGGKMEDLLIAYGDNDYDNRIGHFTSLKLAKSFAKDNVDKYDSILFEDFYGDSIVVKKGNTNEDIDWLFSNKMNKGGLLGGFNYSIGGL